jgi:hypothetical protein
MRIALDIGIFDHHRFWTPSLVTCVLFSSLLPIVATIIVVVFSLLSLVVDRIGRMMSMISHWNYYLASFNMQQISDLKST